MEMKKIKYHHGYVVTESNLILVQVPDSSDPHGFYLTNGEQSWSGGLGIAKLWTPINHGHSVISALDHKEMDWLLQ